MTLGRCPLSIFCSSGTLPDEPTNPESINTLKSSSCGCRRSLTQSGGCRGSLTCCPLLAGPIYISVIIKDKLADLCGN